MSRTVRKPGVTIWIDDITVPAVYGVARVRLWTVWRDIEPRRRVGSTQQPNELKAMVKEALR